MHGVLSPPPLYLGRERERAQIQSALEMVPVAAIVGVAGVGKSALARACAGDAAPVIAVTSLDALRRELERHRDGLLIVEDLHLFPVEARGELLVELARLLGVRRAIVTSRERLPAQKGADRFDLQLEGLRLGAARRLWKLLDALEGWRAGFDVVWRAGRGNPAVLRRAHAGGPVEDHPLAQAVAGLSPDERAVMEAVALARIPLPARAVASMVEGERGEEVFARLSRSLLLDVDGSGRCTLPDAAAAAVRTQLDDPAAAHLRLATALAGADLDPVAMVRETTHQFGSAGQWDRAAEYLSSQAPRLLDRGVSGELLRCLLDVPPRAFTPRLAVWRARCRLRLLDLREGEAEIASVLPSAGPCRRELRALLAQSLLLRGELAEAERVLAEAASDPPGSPQENAWFVIVSALVRCYRDDVGGACRMLLASAEELPDQAPRLRSTAAYLRWLDRYGAGAHDPAPTETADRSMGLRAAALLPVAIGSVARTRDVFMLDTEGALRLIEAKLRTHRDALSRVHLGVVRVLRLWERGQRHDALAELRREAEMAARVEYRLVELWNHVWTGRLLFALGRCGEADSLLLATLERAEAIGARWIVRAAQAARGDDPVLRFREARRPGSPPASVRSVSLALLRAAIEGHERLMQSLLRSCAPALPRRGFGVDRAIVALAQGAVALARGDEPGEADARVRAREALRSEGADAELLERLLGAIGEATRAAQPKGGKVIYYGDTAELRAAGKTISFARRHVLRRLLYRMATAPGESVSKDALAQAAWGVTYHPLRHSNALFVNICRLRALLEDSGLEVALAGDGYALKVPRDFVFVDKGSSLPVTS